MPHINFVSCASVLLSVLLAEAWILLADDRRVWAADRRLPVAALPSVVFFTALQLDLAEFLSFLPPALFHSSRFCWLVSVFAPLPRAITSDTKKPSKRGFIYLFFFTFFVNYAIWTNDLSHPQPLNWCHMVSGDWELSWHHAGCHRILSPHSRNTWRKEGRR